jgi:hypothetical protein
VKPCRVSNVGYTSPEGKAVSNVLLAAWHFSVLIANLPKWRLPPIKPAI